MSYELETGDDERLIIDFDSKEVKGYTTKKGLKKQIETLREAMG